MNIITADQIQQGDTIRVTRVEQDGDRKSTRIYEAVAHEFDALYGVWRTEESWNLFTDRRNIVIELLDRPKPKLTVPTLPNAVVKYVFDCGRTEDRFAVRDAEGKWTCYGADGGPRNKRGSDEDFQAMMLREDPNFKVLFAGVAK